MSEQEIASLEKMPQGEGDPANAGEPNSSAHGQEGEHPSTPSTPQGEPLAHGAEPKDNVEASKFGRKVAHLERTLESISGKFDRFLSQSQPSVPLATNIFEGKSAEDYVTVADAQLGIETALKNQEAKREAAKKERDLAEADYKNRFALKVYNIDPDNYEEVISAINNSSDQIFTGNPENDAAYNYKVAKSQLVLKKQPSKPANNSGVTVRSPSPSNPGFDVKHNPPQVSQFKRNLSDEEKSIVESYGLKPEDINAIL